MAENKINVYMQQRSVVHFSLLFTLNIKMPDLSNEKMLFCQLILAVI